MSNNENSGVEQECDDPNSSCPLYQSREEYITALETWVAQARMWQNISLCFPYYLALNNSLTSNNSNSTNISSQTTDNRVTQQLQPVQVPADLAENEAFEFVLPPIWKRLAAEMIDFLILFIVKLALTLLTLEFIDTTQWQALKDDIIGNITEMHMGSEVTTGIILLEGIHRLIVCMYEVYWLRGSNAIRFNCATPGKSVFGITVITASKIRIVGNRNNRQVVLAHPAKDLGLLVAFGRSFIKNFILAVMFPFCFAFFLFQYNRTGYDVICNTLVVEHDPNPPRRNFDI